MKKVNVTVIATIMLMLVVSMGVGAGTLAYFSDAEHSYDNVIGAGTLNIQIHDSNEGYFDGSPVHASINIPTMAPGDEVASDVITLKNVGSMTVPAILVGFDNMIAHDGDHPNSEPIGADEYILQQIVITKIVMYSDVNPGSGFDTEHFGPDQIDNGKAYEAVWTIASANQDGFISLYDIKYFGMPAGSDPNSWFWFENGNVVSPNTAILPVGGVCSIQFYFKLQTETNNYAQGDYVTFDASFYATQLMPS
jgi:predicted ribosomally synthesized peptide with SipW-like signal peptide